MLRTIPISQVDIPLTALHKKHRKGPKSSHHRFLPSSTPISRSSSASISRLMTGPAAPGSSFVSKAACSCTSSSSSSRKRPWVTGGAGAEVEGEAVEELPPLWARERTMSFLQMGQVRRRVVSQGVLFGLSVMRNCIKGGKKLTCTLRGTRGRKADS
jgi:hypothetical protein